MTSEKLSIGIIIQFCCFLFDVLAVLILELKLAEIGELSDMKTDHLATNFLKCDRE